MTPILIDLLPTIHFVLGFLLAIWAVGFLIRIVLSWYPQVNLKNAFWISCYLITEPFLGTTRRIIGPIGGVDITPVIWFGLTTLIRELLVGQQGILSQILLNSQNLT